MKKFLVAICLFYLPVHCISQSVGLITIDGLNSRVNNGKDTTYIINFWATWCSPCIKELPAFEALNKNFKKEKLKVLLVSVDFKSKLQSTISFVNKNKIAGEVFLLDEDNQQEYIDRINKNWNGAIPATLFIKQDKRQFFEKDFSYAELLTEYQNFK